jgi:hypothetical protein
MTDAELEYLIEALGEIAGRHTEWAVEYRFDRSCGEYDVIHRRGRTDSDLVLSDLPLI